MNDDVGLNNNVVKQLLTIAITLTDSHSTQTHQYTK